MSRIGFGKRVNDSVWFKPWTWGRFHYEPFMTATEIIRREQEMIEDFRMAFDHVLDAVLYNLTQDHIFRRDL